MINCYKKTALFMFITILTGCATSSIEYPLKAKKYKDDLISVQSAVNLAYASFLSGCAYQAQKHGQKTFFEECKSKGKAHVKENLVFFLDQDGKSQNKSSIKK